MATKKTTAKAVAKKATPAPKMVKASASVNIQSAGLPENFSQKLAPGTVKLGGEDSLVINVDRLNKSMIRDQRARLVSSMGCISNPGGPGC